MTDLALSQNSHSVPTLDSIKPAAAILTPPLPSALPNGVAEDEEDYTIKCICGFQEDDGNTVLCETCQTWQHIECYYASQGLETPGEDENHYCRDCGPRSLDSKSAAECQRAKRDGIEPVDAKVKKPATSKGTRKKKATAEQQQQQSQQQQQLPHITNGWSSEKHESNHRNGSNSSPRDLGATATGAAPNKRPKGHRSSNSVQNVPLKLPGQSSRRSASASHALQSPSKSMHRNGHIEGEPYSPDFMRLYDSNNDPGDTTLQGNLINDITIANKLSEWSCDADAIREVTNGRSFQEVFFRCEMPIDDIKKPVIEKRTKMDESKEFHDRHPKWIYLTVETEAPEDMMVGELRGKIGHLEDYFQDPDNRWEDLGHPAPFVFFHPHLPIYIDTRQEGTLCRYVRRSCNPSLKLITIVENNQLRFCFKTTRTLIPGDELTVAWTPDDRVRSTVCQLDSMRPEDVNASKAYLKEYYRKVLSHFGGCACEDPDECGCFKWMRSQHDHKLVNGKPKKGRKGAGQARNNGRTPSSRSGSEAVRHHDDDDQDDDRSTSASSRSKPHSRDATPPELRSDREKRKFEQQLERIAHLEQEERRSKKSKKSRNSGGNASNGNVPASANRLTFPEHSHAKIAMTEGFSTSLPNTPAMVSKTRYADAATGPKSSTSPQALSPPINHHGFGSKAASPWRPPPPPALSPLKRPVYVDQATQVDMDQEQLNARVSTVQRRPVISLTKRLLKRCHMEKLEMDRKREEHVRTSKTPSRSPTFTEVATKGSPLTEAPPVQEVVDNDVKMADADEPSHETNGTTNSVNPLSAEQPSMAPSPPAVAETTASNSPKLKIESPGMSTATLPSLSEDKVKEEKAIVNGAPAADTQAKLPSPPPISTTVTGAVTVSTMPRSPLVPAPTSANNPHLSNVATPLTQPSPIKKKLSLKGYFDRRSSINPKPESMLSTNSTAGSNEKDQSPTAGTPSDVLAKPLESLAEQARAHGAENGSAILETPSNEVGDPMMVDPQPTTS